MWSHILLLLISLFCCIAVYRRLWRVSHPEYLSYGLLLLIAVMQGMIIVNSDLMARTVELLMLSSVLLSLVLLLVTIRLIQPQYSRHPAIYAYFPLTIIPFYAYFVDTAILQFITNISVQATALLVYSGLVITYWKGIEKGYLLFLSILCFGAALYTYWFLDLESSIINSATHLLIGAGMIISSFKFPSIILKHKR